MRQLGALLAIAGLSVMANGTPAQDREMTARFRILVPAEAIVYIGGEQMQSPGTERLFESPLLPVGRSYRYEFKAVWRGKEIVREIPFEPGRTIEIDFRPDFSKSDAPEEGQGSPFRRLKPWIPPMPRYCRGGSESHGGLEPPARIVSSTAPELSPVGPPAA